MPAQRGQVLAYLIGHSAFGHITLSGPYLTNCIVLIRFGNDATAIPVQIVCCVCYTVGTGIDAISQLGHNGTGMAPAATPELVFQHGPHFGGLPPHVAECGIEILSIDVVAAVLANNITGYQFPFQVSFYFLVYSHILGPQGATNFYQSDQHVSVFLIVLLF